MSLFVNLINKYKRATPKQLALTGVFMLAFAGAIGGGFASKATTWAFTGDCDLNAIMKCGAANTSVFIDKVQSNNGGLNNDVKGVYNHFGLSSGLYSDFETYAQQGTFFRDGHIEVAGQTVATNGYSMGRHNFGGSASYPISGVGSYFYGTPNQRWSSGTGSIPVMVWFDEDGVMKMAVMNPCGNPVPKFDKKHPSYSCDALNKHAVTGEKNTYQFTADASNNNLAKVVKFTYSYNDGSGWKVFDTTTSETEKTEKLTLTKASKVRVEIEVVFLSGKKKTHITSVLCEKEIGVVKEEFLHVCEALVATSTDNKTFRFTVQTKQSDGVTVKNADFTLDNTTTVTGVNDKDSDGNIFRNYTFSDAVEHTVKVKQIVFVVEGKDVTVVTPTGKCVAKVTPEKPPVCIHNPNLPPEHPDCKKPECVEKPGSGLPPGHPDCELPVTGPAGVAGLFAGVTAAGAIAHRLFMSRRARLSE